MHRQFQGCCLNLEVLVLLSLESLGHRQHVRHGLCSFCLKQPTQVHLLLCNCLRGFELAIPQIEDVNDFSNKSLMNLE